ncbi:LOW QUALITY PROTEIN: RNA-binding region-containing protein 3-like [Trichosurus vulpecula]|uniref:LOW QUALITY PROTEIN: RNA-binding region-containing protein 3-like n=1 Tax=Trichosurus vulpecula TaxID=9337 RepID=UPI00186ABCC3|nr:LOW QUALITY PROTEIN: RNA-binding region-containing protein 3-like [Trichosurus vulpecula]
MEPEKVSLWQSSSTPPLRRANRTLLVRHLPAELTAEEKGHFLKYFGAQAVRVQTNKGRLKHTAFATFPNENAAIKALLRLHQLNFLGHTLVVEFAKEQDQASSLCHTSYSGEKKRSDEPMEEDQEEKEPSCLTIENGIAPNHGLTFPLNPCLKYLYPPPSSTILTNIANALASVPKFYVQVLHLMNKMNLPAPFGPITARPPTYEEYTPVHIPLPPVPPLLPEKPPVPEEGEGSSGEESEYESGDDEASERTRKLMELANFQAKKPMTSKQRHVRKRQKIKEVWNMSASTSQSNLHPVLLPSDVFEQPQPGKHKKIEFNIPSGIPATFVKDLEGKQRSDLSAPGDTTNEGFGKIFPTPILNDKEEIQEDSDEILTEFISKKDLEKGRISKEEMETLPVFKSYEAGNPNCRIYVKNLAKQVEENDLKFIFGRYVDFSSQTKQIMFDIRLMKEGRMKGQAFIGFPDEKAAAKALKEVNGYVLFGKPMVVQFARSARPKQDAKDGERKR